jgi:hypothetical protein
MQGPVYAEFSSYTRAKPPPQQNDSCSIFRTSLWKTVTEVITRRLAQLSQLRTFFGFFALIFVVKPCVFIVAL